VNRRLLSWRITGAGAALLASAVLVAHGSLALRSGVVTIGNHATAQSQATMCGRRGAVTQAQTAGGDTITLTASADQFGMCTFTVAVRDAKGVPLQGATVDAVLTMPDMQMPALRIALSPSSPPVSGAYQAQGVLAGGWWQAVVRVLAPGTTHAVRTTFRFFVA
jgi:hypothetical protein